MPAHALLLPYEVLRRRILYNIGSFTRLLTGLREDCHKSFLGCFSWNEVSQVFLWKGC